MSSVLEIGMSRVLEIRMSSVLEIRMSRALEVRMPRVLEIVMSSVLEIRMSSVLELRMSDVTKTFRSYLGFTTAALYPSQMKIYFISQTFKRIAIICSYNLTIVVQTFKTSRTFNSRELYLFAGII